MAILFRIGVETSFLAYTIFVNGVPITTDRHDHTRGTELSANHWLVPGANAFRLLLYAPPSAEHLPEDLSAKFTFSVMDTKTRTQDTIAEKTWNRPEELELPIELVLSVEPTLNYDANWLFLRGDSLTVDHAETDSLKRFVGAIWQALDKKDFDQLKLHLAVKSAEMARAFGIPLEERMKDQEEFFQDFFARPDWEMAEMDWDDMIAQVHAGGRLLQITRKDGSPLLQTKPFEDGTNYMLGLQLFRLEGKWLLAR